MNLTTFNHFFPHI